MAEKVFCRSAFNYDRDKASDESGLDCRDGTRTQQHFKDECDINVLVKRFGLTGELPVGLVAPTYQDFAGVFDFHSAMNAVARARESFDELPAEVRYRFNNDPGAFVDFCSDEANVEEARKMGLVTRQEAAPAASDPPPATPVPAKGDPAPKGAAQ